MLQFMFFWSSVWSPAAYIKSTLPRSVPRWRTPDCVPSQFAQTRHWENQLWIKIFLFFSNSGRSEIQSIEYRTQPYSGTLVSIPFKFRIRPSGITVHLTFIFVSAFLSFLKCHCVFVFTCRGFPSTWRRSRGPSRPWWDPRPPTRSRGAGWRARFFFSRFLDFLFWFLDF